jgi:hypothetical protein
MAADHIGERGCPVDLHQVGTSSTSRYQATIHADDDDRCHEGRWNKIAPSTELSIPVDAH